MAQRKTLSQFRGISRKVLTVGSWDDNVTRNRKQWETDKKLQRIRADGMLYRETGSPCTRNKCEKLQ